LTPEVEVALLEVLMCILDAFAWSPNDMLGIDLNFFLSRIGFEPLDKKQSFRNEGSSDKKR